MMSKHRILTRLTGGVCLLAGLAVAAFGILLEGYGGVGGAPGGGPEGVTSPSVATPFLAGGFLLAGIGLVLLFSRSKTDRAP